MTKNVLLLLISHRGDSAVQVQKVLTAWGCIIKTRLGIHDGVLENCSDSGLLIMELVGSENQNQEFERKLSLIEGVTAKLVKLELP